MQKRRHISHETMNHSPEPLVWWHSENCMFSVEQRSISVSPWKDVITLDTLPSCCHTPWMLPQSFCEIVKEYMKQAICEGETLRQV